MFFSNSTSSTVATVFAFTTRLSYIVKQRRIFAAAGSKASALNRGGGAGGSVRTQSQYCHGKGRISVQGNVIIVIKCSY